MSSPGPRAAGDTDAARTAAGGRARRERTLAVLGCLAGSALVLVSAGATWVSAHVQAGGLQDGAVVAAPLPVKWSGGSLVPTASALALLGLAATVAIIATRRVGRILVGLLVLVAGIAIAMLVGEVALDPAGAVRGTDEVRALAPGGNPNLLDVSRSVAPWLAAVGGLLLAVTGALVVARAGTWPAMSARYQARAAAPADAWDAIERGQDPT